MRSKKILAALCAAAVFALGGCSDTDFDDTEYDDSEVLTEKKTDDPETAPTENIGEKLSVSDLGLSAALDDSGRLKLTRSTPGSAPMGEDGTWTIFVYLCGTDLESGSGLATGDISEMPDASTGSNVQFVLQTGGTNGWQNEIIGSDSIGRYMISDGEMYLLDEQPSASMGSADTLADFLSWGVENCPAAKMGVIFWNHGGNNKSEGYTNMADLAGIVAAGADYAEGADEVLSAIDNAVIYTRNGSDHPNACGLASYYPLELHGSSELKVFGDVAVSPYYLSFVDRTVYGNANSGSTEDYDNSSILVFWLSGDYSEDEYEEYWDCYGDCESESDSPLIGFYDEPQLLEDGTFGFSLTDESLEYTASVQANVLMLSDDGEDLIELGVSVDIIADWEYGIFTDNFDGYWFSLPDGQILAVYVVDECGGYDVYTSPVLINGEETNLRITHDYIDGVITINGAWDGIDETAWQPETSPSCARGIR